MALGYDPLNVTSQSLYQINQFNQIQNLNAIGVHLYSFGHSLYT